MISYDDGDDGGDDDGDGSMIVGDISGIRSMLPEILSSIPLPSQ